MAPVPLNVAPSLRPWRIAGVRHLLLEGDAAGLLAPAHCPDADAAETVRASGAAPRFEAGGGPAPFRSAPPQTGPLQAAPSQALLARPPRANAAEPPRREAAPGRAAGALPPARWAPFWQALLRKTPPRPSLLWTYPELSRDLSGAADDAHREFLRRLLGDMALPKGSHAFWPLNGWPPEGEGKEGALGPDGGRVDAVHFLSGVAALNPGTVLLMTGAVPEALGLPRLRLLQPAIVQGRRFVVVPHVDTLIRDPGRYAQLVTFLKALLR